MQAGEGSLSPALSGIGGQAAALSFGSVFFGQAKKMIDKTKKVAVLSLS
jgi:hypothetical protein